MDEESMEISVALPLKSWRAVVAHLESGIYRDAVLAAIGDRRS
jgi:hypothetical protein